jgi:pimeloyl-ACP methyl ester carboxylesterase
MENTTSPSSQIEIRALQANGLTFRCRVCGMENTGEPVIWLHGIPETSQGVLLSLASRGYRCLTPDQRDYSPGAGLEDIKGYATQNHGRIPGIFNRIR